MIRALRLACFLATLLPASAGAQAVRGRVVDAGTGGPIADASLRLLDLDGGDVARTVSDSAGVFHLSTASAGVFRLEARHLGYATVVTDTLRFNFREQAEVVLRMSTTAIPLEPLTVTARRRDERHYATYSGLYERAAAAPPVGPRRVVLRDGPEMRSALNATDVLQQFAPQGCVTLYWNGHMELSLERLDYTAAQELEGVEFYRRHLDAPLELRQLRPACAGARMATVVALWVRRPDGWLAERAPPEPPPTLPTTAVLDARITVAPAGAGDALGVAGRIETTEGYLLEGAVVELVGPRGERFGAVRTAAGGRFALQAPGPGAYHLRVLHRELGAMTSGAFTLAAGERADAVLLLGGA